MSMITIDQPTLPPWADSGVLTVGDRSELLYVYKQDGKTLSKWISPEDMARAYAKVAYDTGVIPEGIMRMGYGQHGWWGILKTPPQIVEMSFLNDDPITVPIPGTIMLGVGSHYRIFAEKDGRLFHAPFDNVYEDGKICWGNNAVPTVKKAADIQKAWKLFFAAPFTHRNDVRGGEMTYKKVYEALATSKAKKYRGKLREAKITLNKLVKIASGDENGGSDD